MGKGEERDRRISTGRQLRAVLGDIDRMKNEDSRTGIIHDKLMEAMDDVHENKNSCFTVEQIDCLKEMMFEIAFIIDPRHKPKRFAKIRHDFSELSWPKRIILFMTLAGMLGSFILWAYNQFAIPSFLHRSDRASSSSVTPPSVSPAPNNVPMTPVLPNSGPPLPPG